MMSNPGSLGSIVPRGEDFLHRKVAQLENRLNQMMTQRTLESAMIGKGGISIRSGAVKVLHAITGTVLVLLDSTGLYINDGGTIVVNSGGSVNLNGGSDLLVDGDITLNGNFIADGGTLRSANYVAGVSGWKLRPDGTAEINDIILRGGIIGNDALTSPLKTDWYTGYAAGYALSTPGGGIGSSTARTSVTVTIPTGFTAVTLFATAQDTARNGTGFTDSIASCINAGSAGTDFVYTPSSDIENGQGASSITVFTESRTGLSGGDTISIQSRPFSQGAGWPADAYNTTFLSVLAIFSR